MGQIKLYKKFYRISLTDESYTLFNPYSLNAKTYNSGTGATESTTIIESSIPIGQDNIGIYFANLNPIYYASDVTYDLVWFIYYTQSASVKKINTRFRINTNLISNEIEIEIVN